MAPVKTWYYQYDICESVTEQNYLAWRSLHVNQIFLDCDLETHFSRTVKKPNKRLWADSGIRSTRGPTIKTDLGGDTGQTLHSPRSAVLNGCLSQ